LEICQGTISVTNLSFKYPGSKEYALKNFSCKLYKGINWIKGPNGSGKSSLINLILGLYTDYNGSISIDDQNIQDYSLESIRNQISVISKDLQFLSGSVLFNLGLSREEITKKLKDLNADCLLAHLPNGLDSIVNENMEGLSQGQKQIVALLRAIVRDSKIISCDEVSANLDESMKSVFLSLVENLSNSATIIIVSHEKFPLDRPVHEVELCLVAS
jgi:ABC-type multidrug transport system fused ATPase/permease subunit